MVSTLQVTGGLHESEAQQGTEGGTVEIAAQSGGERGIADIAAQSGAQSGEEHGTIPDNT